MEIKKTNTILLLYTISNSNNRFIMSFIYFLQVNELYIELEDFSLEKKYAYYNTFSVGSEIEGYPISFLGDYKGTAGNIFIGDNIRWMSTS